MIYITEINYLSLEDNRTVRTLLKNSKLDRPIAYYTYISFHFAILEWSSKCPIAFTVQVSYKFNVTHMEHACGTQFQKH